MNKKKKSAWQIISGIISTVIVAILVVSAITLVGARLLGLQVYTVISGSMEPTYNVGDLLYVKKAQPEDIEVGEPISFVLNEDLVVATHRVVRIDAENQRFYTKGDNNQIEDTNSVHFKNLIGKPVFRVPYLGYISEWIQHPPGIYIAIAIAIALLGFAFIPDLFHSAKEEELREKERKLKEREKELKKKEQELTGLE